MRLCRFYRSSGCHQNTQHPSQRLGGPPEQLISHSERRKILAAHGKLAQPANWYCQLAGNRSRSQLFQGVLPLIGNDTYPTVRGGQHVFNLIQWNILFELHSQCLTVATHGTYTNTDTIHRNHLFTAPQYLVRLGLPLPFFPRLPVAQVPVYPRDKTARKRNTEILRWKIF